MSGRLQIYCASGEEVPEPAFLREKATWEQSILLVFPKNNLDDSAKSRLIAGLSHVLPNHYVSNPGRSTMEDETWVAISRVVSDGYILEHHEAIVRAARDFRHAATLLMGRVADHFQVPLSSLFEWHTFAAMQTGRLDDTWLFFFHGFECGMYNEETGQTLEVVLGFGEEFGVLDPYFFMQFVKTTPEHLPVTEILRDYQCAARTLEVLERHGYLRRVAARYEFLGAGLIAD
jgi:hypothetical protein